jgi:hypothetical protein
MAEVLAARQLFTTLSKYFLITLENRVLYK